MVCSHCQQVGHTYRTCPTITEEEKKEKMKQIKEKKVKEKLSSEVVENVMD